MFINESATPSSLLRDLFAGYRVEGLTVPIAMEEFLRQADKHAVARASVEQLLEGIPLEKRIEGFTNEQILEALTAEFRERMRQLLNEPPKPSKTSSTK